ncbi:hypothetical protein CAC42_4341 [Sphaceloma murrayae]|uniref:Uncharacterized protein n=1 Tax=Sphaceloma murrayae TaxID=2082308 RepID=A0A2K1QM44_9PEZI|nr:hypothetical protein CAC42_4341 [Sphaceloma murrayae]
MLVTTSRGGISVLFGVLVAVLLVSLYTFPSVITLKSTVLGQQARQTLQSLHDGAKQYAGISEHQGIPWVEQAPNIPSPNKVGDAGDRGLAAPGVVSPLPFIDPRLDAYHEVRSRSTADGKYFEMDFSPYTAINPNMIPHPHEPDTWIMVAQRHKVGTRNAFWFTELVCDAIFQNGALKCKEIPSILPIAATSSGHCDENLGYFTLNIGPHDARVFWGPDRPYAMFGSNSMHNCFGQHIQDFRMLVNWNEVPDLLAPFRFGTDLPRPPPYSQVEKNWFVFWDASGDMYLHYDVAPTRSFARLNADSSVGEDLAMASRPRDEACFQQHGPVIDAAASESIHQATNSLAITMCNRMDGECQRTTENTYIMAIFHKKRHRHLHSTYEPYVMLFKQTAPFELHAISSKPLWIHGRKKSGEIERLEAGETEMMYLTSINWRDNGTRYAGYLDDTIFVGFGIEDRRTAGIDVLAEDLLGDLGLC